MIQWNNVYGTFRETIRLRETELNGETDLDSMTKQRRKKFKFIYAFSEISYFYSGEILLEIYENCNKLARSEEDKLFVWKIFNICRGEMYSRTVRIIAFYFLIFHFSSLVCHSRSFQSSVPCFRQNSNPKSVDFGRAINKKFNYVPVMRQTQNFELNAWLDNSSVMLLHRPGSHAGCPLSLSSHFSFIHCSRFICNHRIFCPNGLENNLYLNQATFIKIAKLLVDNDPFNFQTVGNSETWISNDIELE